MTRIIPLLFLFAIAGLQAAPRYITDHTHIAMRVGEGPNQKIQRMLPAGEKVELLSSNSKTDYSKIRDSKSTIGFVLTRQLMTAPSARDRLAKAEEQYAAMKQQMEQPVKLHKDLQQRHQQLLAELNKLKASKGSADSELEEIKTISGDVVKISEERKELRKKLATLTWDFENIKQENLELKNERSQYWFLVGAGVALLGIIIGIILPRLQTSGKKQTW